MAVTTRKIALVLVNIYFVSGFNSVTGSADIVHSDFPATAVTTVAMTTTAVLDPNTSINLTSIEATDGVHNIRSVDKTIAPSSGESLVTNKEVRPMTAAADLPSDELSSVPRGDEISPSGILRRMNISSGEGEMETPLSDLSPIDGKVKVPTTKVSSPSLKEISKEVTPETSKGNILSSMVNSSTSKDDILPLKATPNTTDSKLLSVGISSSTSTANVQPAEDGLTTNDTNQPSLAPELTTAKPDLIPSEVSSNTGSNNSQSLDTNTPTTNPRTPSLEGTLGSTMKKKQSPEVGTVSSANESDFGLVPKTPTLRPALIFIIALALLVLIEVGIVHAVSWWKDKERQPGRTRQTVYNFVRRNLTNKKLSGIEFTDPLDDTSPILQDV